MHNLLASKMEKPGWVFSKVYLAQGKKHGWLLGLMHCASRRKSQGTGRGILGDANSKSVMKI